MKARFGATLCALGVILLTGAPAAQEPQETELARIVQEARDLLSQHGAGRAIEYLQRIRPPELCITAYDALVRELYWQDHDVPAMVTVAQAGIRCALDEARAAGEESDKGRAHLGMAKAMSYNLASFTWPGWGNADVRISKQDQEMGLEAARENLRLAQKLERNAKAISAAHWAIGAHLLALRVWDEAMDAFRTAAEEAEKAGDKEGHLMCLGYMALTRRLQKGPEEQAGLDQALAALEEVDTDDARFYAEQIHTALDALQRPPVPEEEPPPPPPDEDAEDG